LYDKGNENFKNIFRIPILDTSGKINKKELPSVRGFSEEDIDVENFSSSTAKVMATIWCKILKICSLDATDNFFDLGGHSLLAAVVVAQINDSLQTDLSTLDLYNSPTVESLLEKITTGKNDQNAGINLLQDLDNLAIKHM